MSMYNLLVLLCYNDCSAHNSYSIQENLVNVTHVDRGQIEIVKYQRHIILASFKILLFIINLNIFIQETLTVCLERFLMLNLSFVI